jgi:hypothetical protein
MGTTPTYSWPYPEPTDPVANGAQDIEDLALAVESTVSGITGGKILQVVATTKSDTFTASTDNDGTPNPQWASVTGLTADITPTATSSKVLVLVQLSAGYLMSYRITRGGTPIGVGDSAGSRQQATGAGGQDNTYYLDSVIGSYLDSPASTSTLTYGVDVANLSTVSNTVTLYVNRVQNDFDDTSKARAVSSITLLEVSA